jgi:hypothetical protein
VETALVAAVQDQHGEFQVACAIQNVESAHRREASHDNLTGRGLCLCDVAGDLGRGNPGLNARRMFTATNILKGRSHDTRIRSLRPRLYIMQLTESTTTKRSTRSGCSRASMRAIIPPIECPTGTNRCTPSPSSSARTSRASPPIVYGAGVRSLSRGRGGQG